MGNSKKVMLIGWDAADWKVIHDLMDRGHLPAIRKMIEGGVMGNMRTLSPVLSPMLWTSIATGKRPFKHGIYGFTEPVPDGSAVQPMTNVSRKCKAIWNILNQQDMRSLVVGWWPSHPTEPINGVMVSDFFHKAPKKPGDQWKIMPRCIHPKSMTEELSEFRVHPLEFGAEHIFSFIPNAKDIEQDKDPRLSTAMKMLAECTTIHATATHLLETQEWDFAAVYYDAIDHFSHGFMKYRAPRRAHINEKDFEIYKDVIDACYIYHDMILARLMELGGPETTYILMSDHGFHPDHLRPRKIPSEPAGPALEHRDYGIFIASGPGIKEDEIVHSANLLDVTPTILSIYGLPIGDDMDGQPLVSIFKEQQEIKTIPSWEDVSGEDGQHPAGMAIDPAESKEALDQLVALGYIEPPDQDGSKAVKDCQRELDYNLARAYMDAGMHGEGIPLLLQLYLDFPLEFRFGIQLANCLRAMNRNEDLETLVEDLNARWRVAASEARKRVKEIAQVSRERHEHWKELKKIDEANEGDESKPQLAKFLPDGKPKIWEEHETHAIKKTRAVARGNPQTLDFLSATIASSKGDFEGALAFLEKAKVSESPNPGFHFHLGNIYLGLERQNDAEKSYMRALEFDEFHPNAMMGLCRTFVETGQIQKALDFGKQATGLKFHFPLGHYYLARAKHISSDHEGAVHSLNTALAQNPNFVEAHELLVEIYKKSHLDDDLAKQHEAAVRELRAATTEAQASEERLKLPELVEEKFREQLPLLDQFSDSDDVPFIRSLGQAKSTRLAAVEDPAEVVVVTGLPRSGTSMMMQMLIAGGLKPYTDEARTADDSNPRGYFEAEIVKRLPKENNWLDKCSGQVIKVVAPLIPYLPQGIKYKAVFMQRDISEVLQSQTKMLERLEKDGGDIEPDRLALVFQNQVFGALNSFTVHQHPVFVADYKDFVENPKAWAIKLAEFLGGDLDVENMQKAVDPTLYRQKR